MEKELLKTENEQMRRVLSFIAKRETQRPNTDDGICPYGCDCPGIAKDCLATLRGCSENRITYMEAFIADIHTGTEKD